MLAIRDLSARYGQTSALRGVSLDVGQGEIVALLGANGAGKSTLLATVAGLHPAAGGEVALAGAPILGLRPEAIVRRGVALVPERRDLFPDMSVAENLEMGAYVRTDRAAIRQDTETVCGYFPILGQRHRQIASTLSGGEQQMLAIGRALMARPRLLLLDEPSLGIAPRMIEAIFDIIVRINRDEGLTILLVEQNTAAALAVSARAYILETGSIVGSGPSAELARSALVRRSFLGEEEGAA